MIKSSYIFTILVLTFGCNSGDSTAPKIGDSSVVANLKTVAVVSEENFEMFFKKFDSDSVFQRSRIQFPLKYETLGDEGDPSTIKYISKNDIYHIGLHKLKEPKMTSAKKVTDSSKVEIQFRIEDTGYEKNLFFAKRDKKWFLVAVNDLSD